MKMTDGKIIGTSTVQGFDMLLGGVTDICASSSVVYYCQAQLELAISVEIELALLSVFPSACRWPRTGKVSK